jgi:hypothetical protein
VWGCGFKCLASGSSACCGGVSWFLVPVLSGGPGWPTPIHGPGLRAQHDVGTLVGTSSWIAPPGGYGSTQVPDLFGQRWWGHCPHLRLLYGVPRDGSAEGNFGSRAEYGVQMRRAAERLSDREDKSDNHRSRFGICRLQPMGERGTMTYRNRYGPDTLGALTSSRCSRHCRPVTGLSCPSSLLPSSARSEVLDRDARTQTKVRLGCTSTDRTFSLWSRGIAEAAEGGDLYRAPCAPHINANGRVRAR